LSATLRAQDSVTKADTLVHGRAGERSHWDGAEHPHPTLNQSFNTGAIGYSNQELFSQRGAGLVGDVTAARMVAFGEYAEDGTASTVKSRDYKDATDLVAQTSTGDVSHCLNGGGMGRQDYETETLVTHALRGEGFDASEDGTGRGTPLVPVQAFYSTESRCDNFPPPDVSPPLKVGSNGGGQPPAIAFSAKDYAADASEELSPTLRAMPHDASHANGGGQLAVAIPLQDVGKRTGVSTEDPRAGIGIGETGDPMFTLQAGAQHGVAYPLDLRNAGRDPDKRDAVNRQGLGIGEDGDPSPTVSTAFVPGVAAYAFQTRIARNGRGGMGDVVNALTMSGETGKGDTAPCVAVADTLGVGSNQTSGFESEIVAARAAVRRLTPEECESLQGFSRGYTRIPWKKKPAEECPDGPRYKALGNSMAVNVMRWIGERIRAQLAAI
jgi:DNA (cytosine-5)-methyltransferase 1